MNSDIISYYNERSGEYEKVYLKPERQEDLSRLTKVLQGLLTGKEVLEIACGTGYWTQRIAQTAKSIKATDINDSVLDIARTKSYLPGMVTFEKADIFQLSGLELYDSFFGGFIWSHIKIQDLPLFVDIVRRQTLKGGTVVFIDNKFIDGNSLPITSRDNFGNTYQTRTLENGSTHKVTKNFPTRTFIEGLLADKAEDVVYINMAYYWVLHYRSL